MEPIFERKFSKTWENDPEEERRVDEAWRQYEDLQFWDWYIKMIARPRPQINVEALSALNPGPTTS